MTKKLYRSVALCLAGAMSILTACSSQTATLSEVTDDKENAASTTSADNAESTEDYSVKLFDTGLVHSIDIEISEEDWSDLVENPTDKTKYKVNITIDGEKIEEVSFATKGNTSLSSVAADEDSDRYSFKINFGKYVEGQTYYGLDKLNLNNIYSDNTYIKDYLSYQLFNYMGVDAPLASFANITINGEAWGLYLAVEDVGESFLERTDNSDAELYKPETSMLANAGGFGGGRKGEFDPENMPEDFKPENMPEDFDPENFDPEEMMKNFDPENMPEGFGENRSGDDKGRGGFGGFGGFGGQDSGASLKYTDDELESYSDIFDNAETDVTEEDEKRVVEALKNLSEGNISESVDIDSVINYFAVHNFVMNYDSYTGNMLHNYYLLEKDGILEMVPWDYNLAFGGFMNGGMNRPNGQNKENSERSENNESDDNNANNDSNENSATSIINYGIDSPLSGAEEEDRPMWSFIVNNEEYLEKYHDSLEKLSAYVSSDEFTAELDRIYEMILPYVESDATAFATADEFKKGFETIKSFISLRAQSVQKQLTGELSTTTDDQKEEDRIDGDSITIKDMGSQGGGQRGKGGR